MARQSRPCARKRMARECRKFSISSPGPIFSVACAVWSCRGKGIQITVKRKPSTIKKSCTQITKFLFLFSQTTEVLKNKNVYRVMFFHYQNYCIACFQFDSTSSPSCFMTIQRHPIELDRSFVILSSLLGREILNKS